MLHDFSSFSTANETCFLVLRVVPLRDRLRDRPERPRERDWRDGDSPRPRFILSDLCGSGDEEYGGGGDDGTGEVIGGGEGNEDGGGGGGGRLGASDDDLCVFCGFRAGDIDRRASWAPDSGLRGCRACDADLCGSALREPGVDCFPGLGGSDFRRRGLCE